MEYTKLVAVTGLPGLFELINSKTDGAIVRSLDDKSTRFVSSRIHNFTHLESIEIYTVGDNVNLVDLFAAMEKAGAELPDDKNADAVKKYFTKVFPELDFERVYSSDMKKMLRWFVVLKNNGVEIKLSEKPEEEPEVEEMKEETPTKEKKPAKKMESPSGKTKAAEMPEESPTKKPAAKKK